LLGAYGREREAGEVLEAIKNSKVKIKKHAKRQDTIPVIR
jgi:hypothetical protein